ncbi:ATP-NAD kinase [Ktedonosporobacter rubrisoli]|uniref:ATP-NAD kinase n=1 Tax=Ktedonosporobacter rubrisoli TaxID=2509675 RepID=A0A4P6K2F1_KTERU|nr:NAD(+)/NADH kinase [Ktedonosporobacter rubrisoli]QBD81656.1 ATP-NAD kinase [Ktedonosporobacter rubrisoli]
MSRHLVGIIANPASGRDIRRLVAHGTIFDNNEKTAIVRRVLLALEAVGVTRVAYMPEHDFGILQRALDGHREGSPLTVEPLPMPVTGTGADSTQAAQLLCALNAGCIITLGGDGTNRAVAMGCGHVPLVPISTGTNNVFPSFLEGTIAGLAAGLVANGLADNKQHPIVERVPWLEVLIDGVSREHALIDVVVSSLPFVGSRAIWDLSSVREVILSRVAPATIGLSALGSALLDANKATDQFPGLHITLGEGDLQVLAALAPGLVRWVAINAYRRLALNDAVQLRPGVGTVALDGEREIELASTSAVTINLRADGPFVVKVEAALAAAARAGYLSRQISSSPTNAC